MYKTMSDIKNYIDFHYAENLSLEELSRIFYLQPNTISKNFRKTFEKNINSYIHSVRVSNAVRVLEKNDISITELSEVVGYASVNTFCGSSGRVLEFHHCSIKSSLSNIKRTRVKHG